MSDFDTYEKFEEVMHAKYPRMFSRGYGGFAIGEGWFKIIEALCTQIDSHVKWKRGQRARDLIYNRKQKRNPQVEEYEEFSETGFREVIEKVDHVYVRQIKEKFGGLRFYTNGGDQYVSGLIGMAESWAAQTCERCGETGTRRLGGWVRTLCDKHEAEYQAEYQANHGYD